MDKDVTTITGIEQGRAKFAYDCAKKGKTPDSEYPFKDTEYKSYVKNLPSLIKTNGLGQTLAFYKSKRQKESDKKKNAYDLIYNQLYKWLIHENCLTRHVVVSAIGEDLVEKVISMKSLDYRTVTIEVLTFVNWLKRFTDGLIEGEDAGND